MSCRRLAAVALASLLGSCVADTILMTKCPMYANDTNTSKVTLASYCVVNETTATMVSVTSDALDLSHRNISVVSTIPTLATTVDLSFNLIANFPSPSADQSSRVLSLNLSHNVLTSLSFPQLPSTIQTLYVRRRLLDGQDLSYNRITSIDGSVWSNLPRSLQSLTLSGNNLTTLRCSNLPTQLKRLDLSGNAIQSIVMDAASYNLMSQPDFVLTIDPNESIVSTDPTCLTPPSYFNGNYICVTTSATSSSTGSGNFAGFMAKYGAAGFIVLVVLYAANQTFRYRRRHNDDFHERSTYISSNYIKSSAHSSGYVAASSPRATAPTS
ncbi:unnamed protein product [Aphanomyces euteiches]